MLASLSIVCRSCAQQSIHRCFSTIPILQQESRVPPESPKYVDFPKPPQQDIPRFDRIRGFLPVPRDIFKHRSKLDKKNRPGAFINAATKESRRQAPMTTEVAVYKQKLAEDRRQNLRRGLIRLGQRRRHMDSISDTRSQKRQEYRQMLIDSPIPDDVRLTRDTIDKNLRQFLFAKKSTRMKDEGGYFVGSSPGKNMKRQRKEQEDALHTLYTHAREFITTEKELDEAIDKTFDPENLPDRNTRSIWAWQGKPRDLDELMKQSNTGGGQSMEIAQARLRKVAEKLTGGKLG